MKWSLTKEIGWAPRICNSTKWILIKEKVLLKRSVELIVGMASDSLNSFKGIHYFPNISRPGKPPEARIFRDLWRKCKGNPSQKPPEAPIFRLHEGSTKGGGLLAPGVSFGGFWESRKWKGDFILINIFHFLRARQYLLCPIFFHSKVKSHFHTHGDHACEKRYISTLFF